MRQRRRGHRPDQPIDARVRTQDFFGQCNAEIEFVEHLKTVGRCHAGACSMRGADIGEQSTIDFREVFL